MGECLCDGPDNPCREHDTTGSTWVDQDGTQWRWDSGKGVWMRQTWVQGVPDGPLRKDGP